LSYKRGTLVQRIKRPSSKFRSKSAYMREAGRDRAKNWIKEATVRLKDAGVWQDGDALQVASGCQFFFDRCVTLAIAFASERSSVTRQRATGRE
jgi:hypothetical protein